MVECNHESLKQICPCTYSSCNRQGKCCECIKYHLKMDELPGCVFAKISKDAEKSYNRSFEYFAKLVLKE
ncbi:MAG: DUF6485 family protein [Promethearchaeati archaeon]